MNKILLFLFVMSILFLVGCNNSQNLDNTIENSGDEKQEIDNISDIEINGVVYKDINSIEENNINFKNNLVYVEPINESGDFYAKISNDFIIEDSRKNIEKIEILPSKIYSTDIDSKYGYYYNNENYYIPVEKCEIGEERIIYKNYGIEILKENSRMKIYDSIIDDVKGVLKDEYVSLYEVFLEAWKINGEDITEYDEMSCTSPYIYQVDFDNDAESVELIYPSGHDTHIHIDSTYPEYTIISYSQAAGAKKVSNGNEMLWFNNILNYKNVFYGYEAFELDRIDNVICVNENVITGYYIYDKELGLIKVKRFANGEKIDKEGLEKLSKIALTLDTEHTVKFDENGNKYIDAFPMYDREYLVDENGELIINPNSIHIDGGTEIYITDIYDSGYIIKFKTEDGEIYELNYCYT